MWVALPPSFVVRCHDRSLAQDAWAADCTPADDGGIPDDAADACISERDGLRNVILVCAAWLGWAILGFGLAWGFAARIAERDPNSVRGAGGAPCSGCGGYSAIEMRRSSDAAGGSVGRKAARGSRGDSGSAAAAATASQHDNRTVSYDDGEASEGAQLLLSDDRLGAIIPDVGRARGAGAPNGAS